MIIIIVLVIISSLLFVFSHLKRPKNFPPGPPWLPIVGNTPDLKTLSKCLSGQHHALMRLADMHHTNVLGLKLGPDLVVAVLTYPLIKKVLTSEEFEGRPDNFFMRLRCLGTRNGITCTDGEFWSIQRNFVVRHLRNLGFGKKPMETMIQNEVSEILQIIDNENENVNVGELLAPGVINILWNLTTGSRISRDNERLKKLLKFFNERARVFDMAGGVLTQLPWLRHIIPELTGYTLLKKFNQELKMFFMEVIKEHYENWTEGRDDDIIYSFITEMKQRNNVDTTFTEDQLIMTCLDIFIAGSKTTSDTLSFAFLTMILYPEIQKKVQRELDEKIAKTKTIEYSDRTQLPYLEAVLLEVERYYHVTPVTGPRRVLEDTVLDGYNIPKNTTVLIVQYSVHHDKEYWKDPEVFRPERFLNEDNKLTSYDRVIPFGLGRRRCLGEALAKGCIFVFFSEILRKYSITKMPNTPTPTGIPIPGLTLAPEDYKALFTKRIK